jgi:hypothetical protein
VNYDPEFGADHLTAYDLERDVDPPLPSIYDGIWVHYHDYVTATFCRICGRAKGLEVEA